MPCTRVRLSCHPQRLARSAQVLSKPAAQTGGLLYRRLATGPHGHIRRATPADCESAICRQTVCATSGAAQPRCDHPFHERHGRLLTFSAVGKLDGTFWVTAPVAAHSVPRCKVTAKPTHLIASIACPSAV